MDEDIEDMAGLTGIQQEGSFNQNDDPKNATSTVRVSFPPLSPNVNRNHYAITPRGQS